MTDSTLPIPIVRAPRMIAGDGVPELVVRAAPHVLGDAPGIVLDLADVEFISSAGLGKIVEMGLELHERGATLALASPSRPIGRLLKTVGFDKLMPISRSIDDATDDLQRRTSRRA